MYKRQVLPTNWSRPFDPNVQETLLLFTNLPYLCVQEHMPGIKLMYTIGYSLSLAALIMEVTIMVYFR